MSDNIFKDLYKKVIDFFSNTENENKTFEYYFFQ